MRDFKKWGDPINGVGDGGGWYPLTDYVIYIKNTLKLWIIKSSSSVQFYFDNSVQQMNKMWICGENWEKCNLDEWNVHWAKNYFPFFVWLISNFEIAITKFTLQFVNCDAIIWTLSWVYDHKACQQQRKWTKDRKPFFFTFIVRITMYFLRYKHLKGKNDWNFKSGWGWYSLFWTLVYRFWAN